MGTGSSTVWGRATSLCRGVDVLGLGHACELVLIAWQAAEENATTDGQDGGAPRKAVGPGKVIVTFEDQVVELDWIDDEGDDLDDHCGRGEENHQRHTQVRSAFLSQGLDFNLNKIQLVL